MNIGRAVIVYCAFSWFLGAAIVAVAITDPDHDRWL